MYSKLSLLLLTTVMVSCSYFFDEKEKKSNTYNLSLTEKTSVNCIEQNKELLRDYFDLKRSNEEMVVELQKMNTCVNDAISLFVKHTKGANADYYTASEIHEFLTQVFDSYSYEPSFLEDIVILKDSLMGGTSARISKQEVRLLPKYVDFVYQSLAELAPERHLLFSDRKGDEWSKFNPAGEKFIKIVSRFNKLPLKNSGKFDYAGMVRIAKTLIDDEESHWNKTFDLVNSLQMILVKGERDFVNIEQLPKAIEQLAMLYLSYNEFNKFLSETSHCEEGDKECKKTGFFRDYSTVFIFPALVTRIVDYPKAFDGKADILVSTQMKVLNTLKTALNANGGISMAYIYDFIATLTRIEALPESIKADTLNQMAPQFFGFWLSKKPCLKQRCEDTMISGEQVDTLIQFVQGWQERQLWIDQVMTSRNSITREKNKSILKKSGKISSNLLDMQDALDNVQHAHWTEYVHIGHKELDHKDLVIFNKLFSLIKLFLSPFNNNANQAEVLNYYLTQKQVQYFYEWFRPLALELKLNDQRSRSSGEQAFIEINLFGSSSTKPEQMDFAELIEYFQIALSTGSRTDRLMTQKFNDCVVKGTFDVFNYEIRTAECFRQEFLLSAKEYFLKTMPQLLEEYKSQDVVVNYAIKQKKTVFYGKGGATVEEFPAVEGYNAYLKYLEKAGRQGVIANAPFDTDAVRVMSSIAQYAESLFLRFEDPNDDDLVIGPKELQRALLHISPNLNRLLRDSLDPVEVADILKKFPTFESDLVTYMLRYGEIPSILTAITTAEKLKAAIALKTWSIGSKKWIEESAHVTRKDVMLVISGLSAFARASSVKDLRKVFVDNELELKKGFINDPNNPIFFALARELKCSTVRDAEVRAWLVANQNKYWKDVLEYFDIKIGDSQWVLSSNDIPQTGVFTGWEGAVVTELIKQVDASPIGPICGVPFLTDTHKIIEE